MELPYLSTPWVPIIRHSSLGPLSQTVGTPPAGTPYRQVATFEGFVDHGGQLAEHHYLCICLWYHFGLYISKDWIYIETNIENGRVGSATSTLWW
jgi:hypothetical protein